MRKLLDLIFFHIRNNAGTYLLGIIITSLFIVMPYILNRTAPTEQKIPFAVVNGDEGEQAEAILQSYPEAEQLNFVETIEQAEEMLANEDIRIYFVFTNTFSEELNAGNSPHVQAFTSDEETWVQVAPLFVTHIQDAVQTKRTADLYTQYGLSEVDLARNFDVNVQYEDKTSNGLIHITSMLTYTMLFGGSIFAQILLAQKKSRILYRSLSSPTSPRIYIGATLLSSSLVQLLGAVIALVGVSFFIDIQSSDFAKLSLLALALNLLSSGLQLFTLRLFKSEQAAMGLGSFVVIGGIFLEMLDEFKNVITGVPDFVFNLVYLSPFYWAKQSMNGQFALSITILLLCALTLFLMGSMKAQKFVHA